MAIETGLGDAHSMLRALSLVREKSPLTEYVAVCWGDTVFKGGEIFKHTVTLMDGFESNAGYAVCSEDRKPYAWFDLAGGTITGAHFANCEPAPDKAVHDQSLFVFKLDCIITQLCAYRDSLGISENSTYTDSLEMKTLDSFVYFYRNNMKPVLASMVESGLSRSFNTKEEFDAVIKWWGDRG
jgi:hypothetical protein